jgi:hypothetical protein
MGNHVGKRARFDNNGQWCLRYRWEAYLVYRLHVGICYISGKEYI